MADLGEGSDSGMSRREALRAGGLVAGSALWVTPLIQVLSVNEASAESPSGENEKDKKEKKDKKD